MGEVRLSRIAERDLLEIWFHIAADNGAETADYWIDRIEARLDQLSMFPQSAPARPDIAPEARVLVIARWLVLYRVILDGVQVNRVVDAARDLGEVDLADEYPPGQGACHPAIPRNTMSRTGRPHPAAPPPFPAAKFARGNPALTIAGLW